MPPLKAYQLVGFQTVFLRLIRYLKPIPTFSLAHAVFFQATLALIDRAKSKESFA